MGLTTQPSIEPALVDFADRLRDNIGARRVLLFGSRNCVDMTIRATCLAW